MTKTRTETHVEILTALEAYSIRGGFAFAEIRALGEITSLSCDFIRRPAAVYRIATTASGARVLAVRYRRAGSSFVHAAWMQPMVDTQAQAKAIIGGAS